MSEEKTYPVSEATASQSHLSVSQYNEMYQKSIDDAEAFWAEQANEFLTVFETGSDRSSDFTTATAAWFRGAKAMPAIIVLTDTWKNVATKPQ